MRPLDTLSNHSLSRSPNRISQSNNLDSDGIKKVGSSYNKSGSNIFSYNMLREDIRSPNLPKSYGNDDNLNQSSRGLHLGSVIKSSSMIMVPNTESKKLSGMINPISQSQDQLSIKNDSHRSSFDQKDDAVVNVDNNIEGSISSEYKLVKSSMESKKSLIVSESCIHLSVFMSNIDNMQGSNIMTSNDMNNFSPDSSNGPLEESKGSKLLAIKEDKNDDEESSMFLSSESLDFEGEEGKY